MTGATVVGSSFFSIFLMGVVYWYHSYSLSDISHNSLATVCCVLQWE
jgi:hypothetical protein